MTTSKFSKNNRNSTDLELEKRTIHSENFQNCDPNSCAVSPRVVGNTEHGLIKGPNQLRVFGEMGDSGRNLDRLLNLPSMVLNRLSRSGLPLHFPHASLSDFVISSSSTSSSPHRFQAPEETSPLLAKSASTVVSLAAHANGPCAFDIEGRLTADFPSWREDEKMQPDPILYDKRDPPTYVCAPGRRIVALGDVHGDLAKTELALQLAEVLSSDGQGHWVGGNTILVQVGDVLDRGKNEIAILSLLDNLSQQAQHKGGAVFQIIGNHETMNVEGQFRYVQPGGYEEAKNFRDYCEEVHDDDYEAAFAGWYLASKMRKASQLRPYILRWILTPILNRMKIRKGAAARAFLFNPGGPIARKLSQHGVALKVNGWLFAHGAVLPHHVEYGLEKLNEEVTKWMRGDQLQANHQQCPLPFVAIRGDDSIVWSRLYSDIDDKSSCRYNLKACAVLEETLEAVGAKALVVGHSPQIYGINCACKGKIWRIDVGMSRKMLNAEPEVLEIEGDHAQVLKRESVKRI